MASRLGSRRLKERKRYGLVNMNTNWVLCIQQAVLPKGPMWKPPSEPIVKPPRAKSVIAIPPPVNAEAATTVTSPKNENGSPLVVKTPTSTLSSSDSPDRAAPVRKRIPIKIVDGGVPAAEKGVSSSITTSTTGSRRIEEIQSSAADLPMVTLKNIAKPSPAPPQAPPEELSAFLTEVSSQPVSTMMANAGSSPKATDTNDRSRNVRVGGGIWKKGGDNRPVLAERVLERAPPKQAPSRSRGDGEVQKVSDVLNGTSTKVKLVRPPPSKPETLFELERGWQACEAVDDRWALLKVRPLSFGPSYVHPNAAHRQSLLQN